MESSNLRGEWAIRLVVVVLWSGGGTAQWSCQLLATNTLSKKSRAVMISRLMHLPSTSRLVFLAACLLAVRTVFGEPVPISPVVDLAYKSGKGLDSYESERCKLDVYAPANARDLPCIVWFHGGGITGGDKSGEKTVAVCRAMAAEGWVVAAVNYRLSPKAKFPAYVEDAAASVAWMIKNSTRHGGDPRRVFVAGHSAGGYLAAMVAMDERYLAAHGVTPDQLAGVIPIAGQMMTHYTIREERGLPKTRIIADEAATINHAREKTPPLLLLYAEKDMALRGDENRYFAAALAVAGNHNITIREIAGHDHGGIGGRIAEPDSPVRRLIAEFVRSAAKR
jgi:acetyl esterase/lipase